MKIGIEIKRTVELTDGELKSIIELKNQHWKHDEGEHRRWMEENILPDDFHLFMREDALLGYLNLVHVDVTIDQEKCRMLGIGNVCVNQENEHMGMGGILMAAANAFIKKQQLCGILLCRNSLVKFYSKSNWEILNAQNMSISVEKYVHNVMVYDSFQHLPRKVESVEIGRSF